MDIPPISEGARITREEAIRELVLDSFTREEAIKYLSEPDAAKRKAIFTQVQKRIKEGK